MVPAFPSRSESSMSKTAAVRWNGCMRRLSLRLLFHLAALLLRLLRLFGGDLLRWPGFQGEVGDPALRLERPEALVQRQPARLGAHLDDHRRGGALDEAHRVELAREDADAPVAFQVGVDAHVALLPVPGRLGHAAFLAANAGPRARLRAGARRISAPARVPGSRVPPAGQRPSAR